MFASFCDLPVFRAIREEIKISEGLNIGVQVKVNKVTVFFGFYIRQCVVNKYLVVFRPNIYNSTRVDVFTELVLA